MGRKWCNGRCKGGHKVRLPWTKRNRSMYDIIGVGNLARALRDRYVEGLS